MTLQKYYTIFCLFLFLFVLQNSVSAQPKPEIISSGVKVDLISIKFFNSSEGIIYGSDGTILETSDGGKNWIKSKKKSPKFNKYSDTNLLWDIKDGVIIVKSTDGGKSWIEQWRYIKKDKYQEDLDQIYFIDSLRGWVIGRDTILRTTDGGKNWFSNVTLPKVTIRLPFGNHVENLQPDMLNMYFVDDQNIWVIGGCLGAEIACGGIIMHSSDTGENWNYDRITEIGMLIDLKNCGKDCIWLVDFQGNLAKTTNNGKKWQIIDMSDYSDWFENYSLDNETQFPLIDFYLSSLSNCFFLGQNNGAILYSNDGGYSWKQQVIPILSRKDIKDIYLTNDNTIWAVGKEGLILKIKLKN